MRRLALLDEPREREKLDEICRAHGVDPATLRSLVAVVRGQAGKLRRRGLYDQFDDLLGDGGSEA